jgi:hypothetical protein
MSSGPFETLVFSEFVNPAEYYRVTYNTLMYYITNEKQNCYKNAKFNLDEKRDAIFALLRRLENDEKFYSSWMQSYEALMPKLFYDTLRNHIAEECKKLHQCETLYPVVRPEVKDLEYMKFAVEDAKQLYFRREKDMQEMQLKLMVDNHEEKEMSDIY